MLTNRTSEAIERLTEKRLEVLRLAARFYSSKEIARMLEITHHAVDKRLKSVVDELGVENRKQAAMLYLEYERQQNTPTEQGYGQPVYETSDLPDSRTPTDKSLSFDYSSQSEDGDSPFMLAEQAADFDVAPLSDRQFGLPRETTQYHGVVWRRPQTLAGKALMAAGLMIAFVIGFVLLLIAGERLSDVFYKILI